MTDPESRAAPRLLGRYDPPDVRPGDRVYCRYRKAWCRVTGWSAGPLRWPRGRIGKRGRPRLVVNATLVRAIRTESAAALGYWLGLSVNPVTQLRRAFGVSGRLDTLGSRLLRVERSRKAADRHGPPVTAPGRGREVNRF